MNNISIKPLLYNNKNVLCTQCVSLCFLQLKNNTFLFVTDNDIIILKPILSIYSVVHCWHFYSIILPTIPQHKKERFFLYIMHKEIPALFFYSAGIIFAIFGLQSIYGVALYQSGRL